MVKQVFLVLLWGIVSLATRPSPYPYLVQAGTPSAVPNIVNPEAGCNWGGVGGQVFGADGKTVPGLVVRVYGVYNNQPVYANVLTGGTLALGPGGYSYKMGSAAVLNEGTLSVQVFDLSGQALSPAVKFNTSSRCDRNLALVNFVAVETINQIYLPAMRKVQ